AVNLFVYQKLRHLTALGSEAAQADQLLGVLVATDLLAVIFLTGLVLLLNRHLAGREIADRETETAREETEAALRARLADRTRRNQQVQEENAERRRGEEQLRRLQKLESLGKHVGGVGHEFNNYLTVIVGFSEQLLHTLPPGTMEHATAAEIHRAGER